MNSILAGCGSVNKTATIKLKRGKANLQTGLRSQNGHPRGNDQASTKTVVVAVNAAKEITKHALEWALTCIAQPGDHFTLLALQPGASNGRKLWALSKFGGDCANGSKAELNLGDHRERISDSCSYLMQQLHELCDAKQVKVSMKVVQSAGNGATAMEAQRTGAAWVVLDRHLKKEQKLCLEHLHCNVVMVNCFSPKILRLNLKGSPDHSEKMPSARGSLKESDHPAENGGSATTKFMYPASHGTRTPSSSPDETGTSFTATEQGTSSNSSSEPGASPPTSAEVSVSAKSEFNCIDLGLQQHIDAGAEAVSESDTASDKGLVDAVSDSESDDSSPVCRTVSASPDFKFFNPGFKWSKPFDLLTESWLESRSSGGRRDSFSSVEPWKLSSRTTPSSANATPNTNAKQGRASTPASPLSVSKKLAGKGRLSFTLRKGNSSVRNVETNPHSVILPSASMRNGGIGSHTSLPTEFVTSSKLPSVSDKSEMPKRKVAESDHGVQSKPKQCELERISSVRKAMSLSRHVPPGPPPLCSICQHKAPLFGKPPRRFTCAELELATGGFSQANFLAEGGFGSVHRGVLPDGQAVAVKQHKLASSQGDIEFCSEVEVLSCAQHRNVVMLIGYCIEERRRLLVYEFICNGSLDSHLYGSGGDPLEWSARQKIAVGAARGLRYLHEECRVGCIVHRDMRPNNILLTHDFEPMVGDFGLARWQPDGDLGVQTRVIGTFGYLAPEYAQSGQITEKADVYAFGVVLLELVTGRKVVDIDRPKGQQCLTEWARPLLDKRATHDLIDPRLGGKYSEHEVCCMLHAASLCIRKEPELRPRMSQVLHILEGDMRIDTSGSSTPLSGAKLAYDPDHGAACGSRSRRISNEYVISRLGTPSSSPTILRFSGSPPPSLIASYSPSQATPPLIAHHGSRLSLCGNLLEKLSNETLKAVYNDRATNIRRLSLDDMA